MTLTEQTEPVLAAPAGDATQTDGTAPRRPSLSPSRAADFKTCPLLYRFRTIDRLQRMGHLSTPGRGHSELSVGRPSLGA